MIPTTENTDRYFKTDLIQHDTRQLERDIHVVLSKGMKSLPRDIQMDYIKEYSLSGDNAKVFEHPVGLQSVCYIERGDEAWRSGSRDD